MGVGLVKVSRFNREPVTITSSTMTSSSASTTPGADAPAARHSPAATENAVVFLTLFIVFPQVW